MYNMIKHFSDSTIRYIIFALMLTPTVYFLFSYGEIVFILDLYKYSDVLSSTNFFGRILCLVCNFSAVLVSLHLVLRNTRKHKAPYVIDLEKGVVHFDNFTFRDKLGKYYVYTAGDLKDNTFVLLCTTSNKIGNGVNSFPITLFEPPVMIEGSYIPRKISKLVSEDIFTIGKHRYLVCGNYSIYTILNTYLCIKVPLDVYSSGLYITLLSNFSESYVRGCLDYSGLMLDDKWSCTRVENSTTIKDIEDIIAEGECRK